jgi:hypothetical protein
MGVLNKVGLFFFAMSHFNWPITQPKKHFEGSPKWNFLLEDGVNPLWSTYIGEKTTTLGKSSVAIRNIWVNTLRTWGPCENLKRTDWEHEIVKKFNTHTCPPQKTKPWVFQMHVLLPHCLSKISIPTFVCHHFQTIGGLTHESIVSN